MRGCPKREVLEQPYLKMGVNSRRQAAGNEKSAQFVLIRADLFNREAANCVGAISVTLMGEKAQ
jgi:hypothetical protein